MSEQQHLPPEPCKGEWIDVRDRLPESGAPVLVYDLETDNTFMAFFVYYDTGHMICHKLEDSGQWINEPFQWMERPFPAIHRLDKTTRDYYAKAEGITS